MLIYIVWTRNESFQIGSEKKIEIHAEILRFIFFDNWEFRWTREACFFPVNDTGLLALKDLVHAYGFCFEKNKV